MPDPARRVKTISLRLSTLEYEGLKTQYQLRGARTVSDLARLALQDMMTGVPSSHCSLAAKVTELDKRLQALESKK